MGATLLQTGIHHVTVYREGAVVTRVGELDEDWPEQVEVQGLPLSLRDESVRVEAVSPGEDAAPPQPTDVRVGLALPPLEPPPPPPSQEELERVQREIRGLEARLGQLSREQAACDRLGLQLAPAPSEGPDLRPPAAPLDAWMGMIDWLEAGRRARIETRQQVERELEQAHEHLQRLERQQQAARAQRGPDPEEVSKRVVVRLRGGTGRGPLVLKLEYQVPGACWRPSYVLRVAADGRSAELGVRALVAQRSGEPWEQVRLALSTADLRRDTSIPELTSRRIGRRQPPLRKTSYREPPADTEALFRGLDDALDALGGKPAGKGGPPPAPPRPVLEPEGAFEDAVTEFAARKQPQEEWRVPAPQGAPPPGAPPVMASAMPMASMAMPDMEMMADDSPYPERVMSKKAFFGSSRSAKRGRAGRQQAAVSELLGGAMGGGGAAPMEPTPTPEPELRPGQLDYGQLVLRAWDADRSQRGRLRPLQVRDQLGELGEGQQGLVESSLLSARQQARQLVGFPDGTSDVGSASGAFDYRYAGTGLLDLPGDGKVHNVPLFAREAPVSLTLISVPRESDQVVRVAGLKNPLAAPLLAGPADVYLEDEFLVTSPIRTVPAGAELTVGLGVEQGLKVARNTHFDEVNKGGLLSSSTVLVHTVELEVASRLRVPARVEVRERLPLPAEDEKDVTVSLVRVDPPWEDFDQAERRRIEGGKRWCFELGPGQERTLCFSYEVALGGKQELVGGNRRD